MGYPWQRHHQQDSQSHLASSTAQPQDWQQEDKGNCVQSSCSIGF